MMLLNLYYIKAYDNDGEYLSAAIKTGFSEEEAIRQAANDLEKKNWGVQQLTKIAFPLKYEATIQNHF